MRNEARVESGIDILYDMKELMREGESGERKRKERMRIDLARKSWKGRNKCIKGKSRDVEKCKCGIDAHNGEWEKWVR